LLAQSGLVETVRSLKACTVYVPGNSAFSRLPAGVVDNLLKPEHKEELVKLIRYHIIPARWTEVLMDGNDFRMATLGGQPLHIDADDPGGIKIDSAKILRLDISAGNCVIHEEGTLTLEPSCKKWMRPQCPSSSRCNIAAQEPALLNEG
jgi:uncharacterized surface protein with fasciclin (FAS1) repeats